MNDKAALRKHTRFPPDKGDVAFLDDEGPIRDFQPSYSAVILDESYGGCALVVHCNESIPSGKDFVAKVGRLGPMKARVVWSTQLDDAVYKIGLQYQNRM